MGLGYVFAAVGALSFARCAPGTPFAMLLAARFLNGLGKPQ